MRITTPAIVCALRSHGEHGAVVRLMTPEHGLQAAYVRGARGRRMRPVLIAGNVVEANLSARTDSQLPQATLELVHSRGPLLSEPLPTAAIEWATVLTATALPEAQPYPRIHEALAGLLDAVEAAPSASGWGTALVRYELLLLAELGFGLDLERCAVTGSNDALVAVSPRSGRAVSAAEAEPYAGRLLRLPAFVREGGPASWEDIAQGLDLTGHFLLRDLITDRSRPLAEARSRLVERLRRAGGLA
jgi:DNA repair protein RecO (recombination protein O)